MTTEELLQPRYELIADYPGCSFLMNEIISTYSPGWFDHYPHLFRKLNWWEYRDEEDLLSRIKVVEGDDFTIHEVESWDAYHYVATIDSKNKSVIPLNICPKSLVYLPA